MVVGCHAYYMPSTHKLQMHFLTFWIKEMFILSVAKFSAIKIVRTDVGVLNIKAF
jgi:hypothetical protein